MRSTLASTCRLSAPRAVLGSIPRRLTTFSPRSSLSVTSGLRPNCLDGQRRRGCRPVREGRRHPRLAARFPIPTPEAAETLNICVTRRRVAESVVAACGVAGNVAARRSSASKAGRGGPTGSTGSFGAMSFAGPRGSRAPVPLKNEFLFKINILIDSL